MATTKVYEGTWEELSAHAEEFRSLPKLRLIIPDLTKNNSETPAENEPEVTLAERLAGRVGLFDFGDAHISEYTGRKFAELLAEKRREESE